MSRFRLPSPNPTMTMIRLIWAMNPATLSSPPTATAMVLSSPLRWKKRIFTATRAAVDGTARLTNVIANSSRLRRPYGIGIGEAWEVDEGAGESRRLADDQGQDQDRHARAGDGVDDRCDSDLLDRADDRVGHDREQDPHDDVADGEPPDRLEFLLLGADGRDRRLAKIVDVHVGVVGSSSYLGQHGRRLDEVVVAA